LSKPTENFAGRAVVSLESRRAVEMQRMIERHGGAAHVSPSLREAPIEANRSAVEFAHRLLSGQIDAMLLLTGVGVKMFLEAVERQVNRQQLIDSLSDIPTVARGPKPVAAMRELGLTPTLRVPEPNTWRELLQTLDQSMPVANLRVGVQEYGAPNPSLIAGLEARGAIVDCLKLYKWELPEDIEPLRENVRRIARGEADVLMITSAQQIEHLLEVAEDLGKLESLTAALDRMMVASIGPTTSERLRALGLPVDFEPTHPKMGQLVQEASQAVAGLLERKRQLTARVGSSNTTGGASLGQRDMNRTQALAAATLGQPWHDSPFLKACRQEPTPYTPVWLMRQAGRYMPEYRAVRAKTSFLDLCRNPTLCSEVMCTAVDYLGVDAAIIFSDLLPILEPMGMDLEFSPGDGPVIHNPVREAADVDRVIDLRSVDALHYVIETVRQTRADLPDHLPLIGFAGAPFTLASYTIEGGASRNFLHTKTLMYRDEGAWRALMQRLAGAITLYLNAQIEAGAQAVQIFDSWVGCLSPGDYRRYVLPYVKPIIDGLSPGAAVIHFGTGNPELLGPMAEAGGDVIGVDWRIDLAEAWRRVGPRAVQGNLDPTALLGDRDSLRAATRDVLDQAAGRPGHIFNLGHGVLQPTPPENARALVQMVQEMSGK
jgi:uroporphyrinogen decarboxylase